MALGVQVDQEVHQLPWVLWETLHQHLCLLFVQSLQEILSLQEDPQCSCLQPAKDTRKGPHSVRQKTLMIQARKFKQLAEKPFRRDIFLYTNVHYIIGEFTVDLGLTWSTALTWGTRLSRIPRWACEKKRLALSLVLVFNNPTLCLHIIHIIFLLVNKYWVRKEPHNPHHEMFFSK